MAASACSRSRISSDSAAVRSATACSMRWVRPVMLSSMVPSRALATIPSIDSTQALLSVVPEALVFRLLMRRVQERSANCTVSSC